MTVAAFFMSPSLRTEVKSSRFKELLLGNPGNPLDHFRRVSRIVLAQELIDAARVLERQIELDLFRQCERGRRASAGSARRNLRCILSSSSPAPLVVPGRPRVCL